MHFVPAYCPHLNPIERLWGLMHRHTTHNKCYSSFKDFSIAMLNFLRDDVPRNWRTYCDEVTDNFRVIDPKNTGLSCERGIPCIFTRMGLAPPAGRLMRRAGSSS